MKEKIIMKKGIAFIVLLSLTYLGVVTFSNTVYKNDVAIAADTSYQTYGTYATYMTTEITHQTDVEETPTPEVTEKTIQMSYAAGKLTISNLNEKANLIHASYWNGILIGAEILEAENGTKPINAYKGDKFFLWQSVSSMISICPAITVNEGAEPPTPTPEPTHAPTPTPIPTPEADKTLVVYFSATGSTERVANYIKDATNADIFKLKPINPYTSADLNYGNSSSRVSLEHDNPELQDIPLVSTSVPNWESYDTVFVGYPIWWHAAAWPVNRFIKENDFTGKTVIPFSTSASSREVGGEALEEMTKTGTWFTGIGFYSSASESTVKDWVDSLNLK